MENLAALEGLAETGDASDADYFDQLLSHPLPSRRGVAIRGIGRVRTESAIPVLLAHLKDQSPGVAREARKALEPYLHILQSTELLAVALEASTFFARQNATILLSKLGKWRSIPCLLCVAADAEIETAKLAEHEIEKWHRCNNVFTRPAEEERQDIESAILRFKDRLSEKLLCSVSHELRRFK